MSSQSFEGSITFPDTVQCNNLESKAATITVPTGVASTLTINQSGSVILLGTNKSGEFERSGESGEFERSEIGSRVGSRRIGNRVGGRKIGRV